MLMRHASSPAAWKASNISLSPLLPLKQPNPNRTKPNQTKPKTAITLQEVVHVYIPCLQAGGVEGGQHLPVAVASLLAKHAYLGLRPPPPTAASIHDSGVTSGVKVSLYSGPVRVVMAASWDTFSYIDCCIRAVRGIRKGTVCFCLPVGACVL